MKEISMHVGKRIRFYRKKSGMTIEVFAQKIQKSKATVSKYENGEIAIDVETLFTIAQALQVSPGQLIDYAMPQMYQRPEVLLESDRQSRLYMYYYYGKQNKLVQSVIELNGSLTDVSAKARLFLEVSDVEDCYSCKFLYHGDMRRFDSFTIFMLENQNNPVERLLLYTVNSFNPMGRMTGMLSGITTQPLAPVSLKYFLSPVPLEVNEQLIEDLTFTKEELKAIRRCNMFLLGET